MQRVAGVNTLWNMYPLQRVAGTNTKQCRCRGTICQNRVSVPHIILCKTVHSLGHVDYRNTTAFLFTHANTCFRLYRSGMQGALLPLKVESMDATAGMKCFSRTTPWLKMFSQLVRKSTTKPTGFKSFVVVSCFDNRAPAWFAKILPRAHDPSA